MTKREQLAYIMTKFKGVSWLWARQLEHAVTTTFAAGRYVEFVCASVYIWQIDYIYS